MRNYFVITVLLLSFSMHSARSEKQNYDELIEKLEEEKAALKKLEEEFFNDPLTDNDPEIERRLDQDSLKRQLSYDEDIHKKFPNIIYGEDGNPLDEFAVNEALSEQIYGQREGDKIYHGDIMMSKEEDEVTFEHPGEDAKIKDDVYYDGLRNANYRWPLTVPYNLAPSLPRQTRTNFVSALREIEKKTCIRFRDMRGRSAPNFLYIFPGDGCWSYVGKVIRGRQRISLGNGCHHRSTAMHEVIHALGFYHEQSRPDRDNYIRILTQNMVNGAASQFTKQSLTNVAYFGVPYDIKSTMHYGKFAFSRNRQPTIVSRRNANDILGQGYQNNLPLPDSDAKQLNNMYNCRDTGKTTTTTTKAPETTEEPTTTEAPTKTDEPEGTVSPEINTKLSRIIGMLDNLKKVLCKILSQQLCSNL